MGIFKNIFNFSKLKEETKMTKSTVAILFVAVFVVAVLLQSSFNINPFAKKVAEPVYKISLKEVELFYSPETKRVLFLDRNAETVKQILSEDLTTAVFSIKAFEVTDFNKEAQPVKEATSSKRSKNTQ